MVRTVDEAECEEVRSDLARFLAARPDLTCHDLAQYTTLAGTTLRMFHCGRMPGGSQVVSETRRVLQLAWAGEILAPGGREAVVVTDGAPAARPRVPREGKFYETTTVRRVGDVLDYCHEHAAIGVITADFGVGKTEAIRAWLRGRGREIECAVVELEEFSSTDKCRFIRRLCQQFDLPVRLGNYYGGEMFDDLVEYLREHPCLLIIDQAECLRPRVCQVIRQIHDRTQDRGVGVVMLGAPVLMSRMLSSKMADLGALTSRVGIWAPLSGLTRGEMASIVKSEGFIDVDQEAFALWAQAVNGSMRRLMRSIDLLRSKHDGKRITEKTIEGVGGHLWGMNLGRPQ